MSSKEGDRSLPCSKRTSGETVKSQDNKAAVGNIAGFRTEIPENKSSTTLLAHVAHKAYQRCTERCYMSFVSALLIASPG